MAIFHVLARAKFLRGMISGSGGDIKETQGAFRAYPDILLLPSAQILMRLGKRFNKKGHCF